MNPTWLYVGVLYAAAVALIRRFQPLLSRRIAVLFYALVLAFLFRPMTGDWVNVGTDVIELVAPWSIGSHYTKFNVANPMLQDPPLQLVPWADEVRKAWTSGHLPLWQDLTECGGPLLGNGQSAALSPLRLATLPLSLGHAMTAEAALKLLMALTFTWLYCRRRKYSQWASLIAALSFGFSMFLVVWLHYALSTTACFLPAVFFSIDLLAELRSASRFAFSALTWATVLFAGHIETAAHMAAISALYVVWIALFELKEVRGRFLLAIAGAAAAALVVASPVLIALGEAVLRSKRFADLHAKPYGLIPFSDYPSLFLSLQPRFFGSGPRQFFGPAHAESVSGFAGALGFAGLIAVIRRAPFARRWRHVETFFAAGWLLALLVIADVEWARGFVTAVIPFTAHGRVRVVLCWMTALLAAALVDACRDRAAVLTGIIAEAVALGWTMHVIRMPDAATQRSAIMTSLPAFAVLAAACLLVVPRWRKIALPLLAVVVLADLWLPAYRWNPARRTETLYLKTPLIATLQRLNMARERFVGTGSQLFPNTNAIFGVPDIRHNDPTVKVAYVKALSLAASFDQSGYYSNWTDLETPFINFLNVRWAATLPGAPLLDAKRYRLAYDGYDGRLYENREALPRFFAVSDVEVFGDASHFDEAMRTNRDWRRTAIISAAPTDPIVARDLFAPHAQPAAVRIASSAPTRYSLEVDSQRHALVVSSIPTYPGWQVREAGRALHPIQVNGAFLGFIVPPGSSRIEVAYRPRHIYAALVLSVTAVAGLLAAAVVSRRRTAHARRAK